MRQHIIVRLQYSIISLFILVIAAAQTAIADPPTAELAEKTPPADPGYPALAGPPPTPCVPIDCGGYFACFCQSVVRIVPSLVHMQRLPCCKQPSARAAPWLQTTIVVSVTQISLAPTCLWVAASVGGGVRGLLNAIHQMNQPYPAALRINGARSVAVTSLEPNDEQEVAKCA